MVFLLILLLFTKVIWVMTWNMCDSFSHESSDSLLACDYLFILMDISIRDGKLADLVIPLL